MDEHPRGIFSSPERDGLHEKPLEQLTEAEFWERANAQANGVLADGRLEEYAEYLECDCQSGRFLVPLTALYEVVPPPHLFTFLPATPNWMCGLTAWHGEAIAVVDLDAYLSSHSVECGFIQHVRPPSAGQSTQSTAPIEAVLLIAGHSNIYVGLLVQSCGLTITIQEEQLTAARDVPVTYAQAVKGMYAEALMLDVAVLLADMVQQIEGAGSLSGGEESLS